MATPPPGATTGASGAGSAGDHVLDEDHHTGTVTSMSDDSLPPKAVGVDGKILLPAAATDPVSKILAAGDRDRIAMSRRARAIGVLTVALIVGTLLVGVGATNLADTPQQREARAADQQVRQLNDYLAGLDSGRTTFPPPPGSPVVATETGPGLWRVTIRSFDGRCWQVLATTTITSPDAPLRLLAYERGPYQVEAIHCRFNP